MKRPFDGKALGEQVVCFVRGFVGKQVASLRGSIAALDERIKSIPAGPQGERGERGEPGPMGEKGDRGETGPTGEKGADGRDGAPGPQGDRGEKGEKGDSGHAGADGKSAYELAVEKGFSGTELQWLESLRGRDGTAGRDGRDGRDAAQLSILPMLEADKSYPSGVYARHLGGLVCTNGRGGYDTIVNGIAHEEETVSEDGRTTTRRTVYTDGTEFVRTHKTASVLYRGVWRPGTHERGDMVTRDGSTWHCNAETTTAEPGKSPDWQLAVKRGNNGRDGQPGKDGAPGKDGKDGWTQR